MKKKVTVTAKAIVNDGEGIVSIIITDNLPKSCINIIGHYADVRYDKGKKKYNITFVNSRITDDLLQYGLIINDAAFKLFKYLNRKGLKDCIIHEESITKTYSKVVDKIVIGVDIKGGCGKLYVHVYLPDRKEYFELGIHKENGRDGTIYFLNYGSDAKLLERLDEDEFNVVHDKLFHFCFDKIGPFRKSFVKTIKC